MKTYIILIFWTPLSRNHCARVPHVRTGLGGTARRYGRAFRASRHRRNSHFRRKLTSQLVSSQRYGTSHGAPAPGLGCSTMPRLGSGLSPNVSCYISRPCRGLRHVPSRPLTALFEHADLLQKRQEYRQLVIFRRAVQGAPGHLENLKMLGRIRSYRLSAPGSVCGFV